MDAPRLVVLFLFPCVVYVATLPVIEDACATNCTCEEEDDNGLTVTCMFKDELKIPQLSHTESVKILDLSQNQLKLVANNSFANYSTLSVLTLSYNEIEIIETAAFFGLEMVRDIDLSYNNLKSIRPDVFRGNPVLETVSLRGNSLVYLPVDSPILISSSISSLDLSSCSIMAVYSTTFSRLPKLYTLDLSSNNLRNISLETFKNLTDLALVELYNNRWKCDCGTIWLMEWVNGKREKEYFHKPVKCQDGEKFKIWWTATTGSGSCSETTDSASKLVKVEELTVSLPDFEVELNNMETSTILPTLPPSKIPANKSKERKLLLPDYLPETTEEKAEEETSEGWTDVLSWNQNTVLVFIVLPCTLGVAVFVSLMAVNYFTKRIAVTMSNEPLLSCQAEKSRHCGSCKDEDYHVYEEIR